MLDYSVVVMWGMMIGNMYDVCDECVLDECDVRF